MACSNLTKEQLDQIVLSVVRQMNHNNPNIKPEGIQPDTSFDDDIGDDSSARRRYRLPIVLILEHHGCALAAPPSDFESCDTVKDLMDLVSKNARC